MIGLGKHWYEFSPKEREQVIGRAKEEIAAIEAWMLSSPKRPIYLRIADSPVFSFRRFTDEEYLAIQARLPKSEVEAAELLKDKEADERERDAEIRDLEKCSLDPIKHEVWVGMDWRDRLALWAELLTIAQQREENVTKFRPNQQGTNASENMLPLPTLPPLPTSSVSA